MLDLLFGVECEGYGVRLTWLTSQREGHFSAEVDEASRPRRSMRVFDNPEACLAPLWSDLEIDAMLNRIDDCPSESSRIEHGVFSVFPMQPPKAVTSILELDTRGNSGGDRSETNTASHPASLRPGANLSNSSTIQNQLSLAQCSVANAGDLNLTALAHNAKEIVAGTLTAENAELPSQDRHGRGNAAVDIHDLGRTSPVQPIAQQPPRHLDMLQIPSSEKRLIHHWVAYTSGKLVLVDEAHNPCRSMMLPMALKGLMSKWNDSTADIAVFHAICAGAAYNLFELGGRKSDEDKALAWRHDELAIHHLRHNLVQADQQRTQSLGMAIMACITIEAISGNTSRWRTHLDGALAYLSELRQTVIGLEVSLAFQIHLVPMAIFCGYQVPAELKTFLEDDAEKLELSFPYYGISQSFLRHLDYINTFASSTSTPNQNELDAIELQLYLDFPSNSGGTQSAAHTAILHYMTQAFYYALLVYYQRSVQRAAISSVHTLVEKGLLQLEAIEAATKGTSGSVMMWAPLVLGAECSTTDQQRRMRSWFAIKRRLGFRNIIILEEMIYDIWEKRARGDEQTTWQDLIVKDRFDVFRL
ncbi:hypothetical protein TruAng_008118 [Truncatella angustata]|nr:hypothetical protein TruAng_008118 [Truncatella angustata]